jgi:uncharacterized membrane protein YbhN (UPF0104 family)
MTKVGHRSRWYVVWYPVAGIVLVDIAYQLIVSLHQANMISQAKVWFLLLAVANQMVAYAVLTIPMRDFYRACGIWLTKRRTFGILATGLAVTRVIPFGDYLVWRAALHRERGNATASTQWAVLYYVWLSAGLIFLFLISELATLVFYPDSHATTLAADLRALPISVGIVFMIALGLTRFSWIRDHLKKLAFDRLGSKALSPFGIIRDRHIGPDLLTGLTLASLVCWVVEGLTLYLCLSAMGLRIPIIIGMFGFAFARLFALIPLTPGAVGEIEAATAVFFVAYGYPLELVFTGTVLYRLITYWPALIVGAVSYFAGRSDSSPGGFSLKDPVFAHQLHRRVGAPSTR